MLLLLCVCVDSFNFSVSHLHYKPLIEKKRNNQFHNITINKNKNKMVNRYQKIFSLNKKKIFIHLTKKKEFTYSLDVF